MVRWWQLVVVCACAVAGCGGRSKSDETPARGVVLDVLDVVPPVDGGCPEKYVFDDGVPVWGTFENGDDLCHRRCSAGADCADHHCDTRNECSGDYCHDGYSACDLPDAY